MPGQAKPGERAPLVEKQPRQLSRRATFLDQPAVIAKLSMPAKILGFLLSFGTVIFIWEGIDALVKVAVAENSKDGVRKSDPRHAARVEIVVYAVTAAIGGIFLALSHFCLAIHLKTKESTSAAALAASSALAVATLLLAAGAWGLVASLVILAFPHEGDRLYAWLLGGLILLLGTVVYSACTKHHALLDIASCVTSLGLYSEDENYAAEEEGLASH